MSTIKTIVLVLRSGKDFSMSDVELINRHINIKWQSEEKFRVICLWDKATQHYKLGNLELIPLKNNYPGTWSRMQLYSPEMEQYRPFLYIDLDTAIITSIKNIFDLVKDESKFITLEDFWQKRQLATGLVWFPNNSQKIKHVWDIWIKEHQTRGSRMDMFLRKHIEADIFWQQLTDLIVDFKPKNRQLVTKLPKDVNLVCFHGKPRVHQAINIEWVNDYVNYELCV
jgi:hypothetical protein